jgi:uroporphyrinogen-III decarboxylase
MDQLSRDQELQTRLEQAPEWDLVVFDESHRMSAHYFGSEVKRTKRYDMGKRVGNHARNLLLMTATPHNGKDEDFQLFMALLDEPEWIRDMGRVYTDLNKACYGKLLDAGARPDGIWIYEDLGYRDRLFCSPDILRDLVFPFYREMVEFFHGYGLPVVLHSCGYQKPMIPLAIEAGFDALNPMEVKAGNDIFSYAETYGDKLVFIGGFDARILERGDRPAIRAAVKTFMIGMKERGARFIFGSDHSLTPQIAYRDFQYALEVYREFR